MLQSIIELLWGIGLFVFGVSGVLLTVALLAVPAYAIQHSKRRTLASVVTLFAPSVIVACSGGDRWAVMITMLVSGVYIMLAIGTAEEPEE